MEQFITISGSFADNREHTVSSVRRRTVVDQFHDELRSRVGHVGFDWSKLIDSVDDATQSRPAVSFVATHEEISSDGTVSELDLQRSGELFFCIHVFVSIVVNSNVDQPVCSLVVVQDPNWFFSHLMLSISRRLVSRSNIKTSSFLSCAVRNCVFIFTRHWCWSFQGCYVGVSALTTLVQEHWYRCHLCFNMNVTYCRHAPWKKRLMFGTFSSLQSPCVFEVTSEDSSTLFLLCDVCGFVMDLPSYFRCRSIWDLSPLSAAVKTCRSGLSFQSLEPLPRRSPRPSSESSW